MEHLLPFIHNHLLLVGAAVALVIALIADELIRRAQGTRDLGSTAAIQLINRGASVIDLRDAIDFRHAHIGDARNITPDTLGDHLDSLGADDHGVLFYCAEGKEGAKAARILGARNIKQVFNLKGGFSEWQRQSLPVKKGK